MRSDVALTLFLAGILLSLMASIGLVLFVATEKNRSGFGWAILALLFSPLLVLIALAALPVERGDEPVDVPEVPELEWRKG